jgi:hypothetical protein
MSKLCCRIICLHHWMLLLTKRTRNLPNTKSLFSSTRPIFFEQFEVRYYLLFPKLLRHAAVWVHFDVSRSRQRIKLIKCVSSLHRMWFTYRTVCVGFHSHTPSTDFTVFTHWPWLASHWGISHCVVASTAGYYFLCTNCNRKWLARTDSVANTRNYLEMYVIVHILFHYIITVLCIKDIV